MAPLVVMIAAWAGFRLVGTAGALDVTNSWTGALRFALAAMFAFTAVSHFLPKIRAELIRMVPASLPRPEWLVSLTGILELLGAAGLLLPGLVRASAYALIALLVALFPANIRAARLRLLVAGRTAPRLLIRVSIQIFWIAALWWVAR